MLLEKEIIDYKEHEDEILKWTSLKGETKYFEYILLLKNKKIMVKWENLDDYVKYDKRLLINLYKYFSAFEDYLRALIWNNDNVNFRKINDMEIRAEINKVYELIDKIKLSKIDISFIHSNLETLAALRNAVAHSKILSGRKYNGKDLDEAILIFGKSLPNSYQEGFFKDISSCKIGLNIFKQNKSA